MIIAIFILQKMHQIEISPLPHKYHVLLLKGSMCRKPVETFDFFLPTPWLSLAPCPFPLPQQENKEGFWRTGASRGRKISPARAGPQVTCSHGSEGSEKKKGEGIACFSWPLPLLPPLFPTVCWQCSSSPHNYNFEWILSLCLQFIFSPALLFFFSTNLSTSNCTWM